MEETNIKSDSGPSYFIQEHSPMIRIWHWITFIIMTGVMITVLLNSTIMNQRANIAVVQDQLKSKGVIVTEDQAFAVSREYEDKLWGVHTWLGYGLAFLLLSRVIIELVQPGEEKLRTRFKSAIGMYKLKDENNVEYRHYLGVKVSYLIFYLLLLCMALTGLTLAFGNKLGISRALHGTIKEIHSFGQYVIYAFVIFHLCAVIITDIKNAKGLVSGMINGNR